MVVVCMPCQHKKVRYAKSEPGVNSENSMLRIDATHIIVPEIDDRGESPRRPI